jgi:hypothetical protein
MKARGWLEVVPDEDHAFCPPISGQRESRPAPRPGTPEEAAALSAFDLAGFQSYALRADVATGSC